MSPIHPGHAVTWTAEGQTMTGRVLNLFPSLHIEKAADGAEVPGVARVRRVVDGQDTDEVQVLGADALTPLLDTVDAVAKQASPADLDALLANLTEAERSLIATAWFAHNGPRLPTRIVGEVGARTPMDGIDQGNGALDQA